MGCLILNKSFIPHYLSVYKQHDHEVNQRHRVSMSTVRQVRLPKLQQRPSHEADQLKKEIKELEHQVVVVRGFVESGIPLAKKTINRLGILLDSRISADLTDKKIMGQVFDLTGLGVKKSGTRLPTRPGTPAPFPLSNDIEILKTRRDMLIKSLDNHENAVKILHRVINRGTKVMETMDPDMLYDSTEDLPDPDFSSGAADRRADNTRRDMLRLPSIARSNLGAR